MPVRHRTHFTAQGERKKCPPDLEGKLRNPLCRKELTESGQGKSGYGPIPPGPGPPIIPPIPPIIPPITPPVNPPIIPPYVPPFNPPPVPPSGPGSGGVRPMDIIEPIVAGGLTGYGAYRARRALGKIQRNRAKGFDWRGRPIRGRGTDIEMRPLRPQNVEEEDIEERAGSTETRGRELREARNIQRSRPNRSSILDDEPEERPRPRPRRLSARGFADEQGPRGPRVPSRLTTTSLDEPAEQELRPVDQIRFTNVEEDPTLEEGDEGEFGEPERAPDVRIRPQPEPTEEFRPVSLDDPENPAVQQSWRRTFTRRLQQLIRRPPTADPEAAETELTEARSAEASAQAEATEADTTLQDVDDAVEQSRTQLERQQNELRQTRTQLTEEPEEARPTDLPDDTYDEEALDAQAEANVAGEEAEGLEDSGDIRANLEEEEELEDPEADIGEDVGDVAEVGGDVAEDTTALTLEEAAGESELLGGGPENPIGDIVAGSLAIAGAAVALGQWFSSLFHHNPSWNGISNATALTGSSYTNMIDNINKEISNTTDQNKIKALNQYKSTLQTAQSQGRAIVSYHNSKGNKAIAVQLSKKELANAIQAYQVNPNVYKGWDQNKLKVMGLNPNMSLGAAGATKTPNGTYVPTMAYDAAQKGQAKWTSGAGGGNWSNFYLSEAYQKTIEQGGYNDSVNTFTSLGDIQDSGNTPAEKKAIADGIYMQDLQSQIGFYKMGTFFTGYNDGTYNWLKYKLALFKYQNGYSNVKPTPVPPPMTKEGKEEMAKLQAKENKLNTSIATANAQLTKQQAQKAVLDFMKGN